ncbi:MAG: ornithine cyclodeaminase family protein, partial [Sphaerochaetaceae bacterium]|nr:ornithine cyclodeaminase family protein [Sphaerochaetaceae bacterium]
HITSKGSDAEDKQELKGGVFAKADLIACDQRAQSFRLGELRGAKEEGFVTDKTPVKEIGEIIRTGKSARTDKKQVTICDLTGVGVQDTMIALMAYEIAKREKAGIVVPR